MAKILLGVSGSIAAYKAADLASKLKQSGHDVTAILTRSATQLVSPNTFLNLTGNHVYVDLWDPKGQTDHIRLTDEADLVLVAPATANTLAKMATGLADDMLSTTLLAVRCPVVVCPAMNTRMWEHPIVRRNLAAVRALGHHVIEPDAGSLACGHTGPGRLAEPARIVAFVAEVLGGEVVPEGSRVFLERQVLKNEPDPALLVRERTYRQELDAAGVLIASGPLGVGDREACHLVRAATLDEARSRAESSPLFQAEVVTVELVEWRLELGALAQPPPRPPRLSSSPPASSPFEPDAATADLPTVRFRAEERPTP